MPVNFDLHEKTYLHSNHFGNASLSKESKYFIFHLVTSLYFVELLELNVLFIVLCKMNLKMMAYNWYV